MILHTPPRDEDNIEDDEQLEVINLNDGDMEMDNSDFNESDVEISDAEREEIGDIVDNAVLSFEEHGSAVFGCDLHPLRKIAVTGGQDDCVYVWDTQTAKVLQKFTHHTDTVTETHFSHDGMYLATADMSGKIYVYKLNELISSATDLLTVIWEHMIGDMTWMRWHNAANVLLASCESGEIYMVRIPSGELKLMPGFNMRCEAGQLTEDGKKLFAGYADSTLKLWDLKSSKTLVTVDQNNLPVTLSSITAIACHKNSSLYAAGDDNGCIVFCTHSGFVGHVKADSSIERLTFSPAASEMQVCVSGSLNGQIAIWDYTRFCLRTLCSNAEEGDGISALKFLNDLIFVVATINGNICGYDVRSEQRLFKLTGHLKTIYELAYKKSDNMLLSVSEDFTARIFVPQIM